ncbi:MAG TPA: NlpC/P60 family protein, partial [Prosthecobacter sp.]
LLPGRALSVGDLRSDYVRRLGTFKNARYAWGGESRHGIDCSGLPRRAFREALLAYGLRNLNGTAIREGVLQWWVDASALALGKGYRGMTVPLGIQGPIRTLDVSRLQPGDLAVTTSGVHMLAYLGDEEWIQADPSVEAVIALNGRTAANAWFDQPVILHRWALLAP